MAGFPILILANENKSSMSIELLWAAALGFLASLVASARSFRQPCPQRRGPLHALGFSTGWFLLTVWLTLRGKAESSCPMNSLFDMLVFLAWSLGLIFLLVGPTFRLSLMGAFTAPLALVLLLAALLLPIPREPVRRVVPNPWIEVHGGLSLIAYGCLGLAAVAGVMYLLQERQLKSGRFQALTQNLPPISELASVNHLLLAWGLCLLTLAFAAGFLSGLAVHGVKFWASALVWLACAGALAVQKLWPQPAGRLALASLVIFAAAWMSLPVVQFFSAG